MPNRLEITCREHFEIKRVKCKKEKDGAKVLWFSAYRYTGIQKMEGFEGAFDFHLFSTGTIWLFVLPN